MHWLKENYDWLSLLLQGIIAYHIFFLSKQLSDKEKLEHKQNIKKIIDDHISNIEKNNLHRKVYLVNIDRYFKKYPSNKENILGQYSHIRADIKATKFNGVEFFEGMPVPLYQKKDGGLSIKGDDKEKIFNAYPVGLIPYEWIDSVDLDGDDCNTSPLIFCHFKGELWWRWRKPFFFPKFPYKETRYYKENPNYRKGNDPSDFQYSLVREEISKK